MATWGSYLARLLPRRFFNSGEQASEVVNSVSTVGLEIDSIQFEEEIPLQVATFGMG